MTVQPVPARSLSSGDLVPLLGQGTRGMAESPARRADETAALRLGVELGLRLVDTAESYADGATEELVGQALAGQRDEVFLVTRVSAANGTRDGVLRACERSLRRLRTDRIDLYVLERRGPVPLAETVEALMSLLTRGLIRHWGVGGFDVADLTDLTAVPGGTAVEADQVPYSLARRGIERELLPRCRAAHLPVLAHSPLAQGGLLTHPALHAVARRHRATPAQVALAWVLRAGQVCAVTKTGDPARVRENRGALDLALGPDDLTTLDQAFPPPEQAGPGAEPGATAER